jgi:hypothetical protein
MRQREDNDRRAGPLEEARTEARKPYQKPAVRYERVFETSALSCGKVQVTQGSCRFNRHAS